MSIGTYGMRTVANARVGAFHACCSVCNVRRSSGSVERASAPRRVGRTPMARGACGTAPRSEASELSDRRSSAESCGSPVGETAAAPSTTVCRSTDIDVGAAPGWSGPGRWLRNTVVVASVVPVGSTRSTVTGWIPEDGSRTRSSGWERLERTGMSRTTPTSGSPSSASARVVGVCNRFGGDAPSSTASSESRRVPRGVGRIRWWIEVRTVVSAGTSPTTRISTRKSPSGGTQGETLVTSMLVAVVAASDCVEVSAATAAVAATAAATTSLIIDQRHRDRPERWGPVTGPAD